MSLYVCHKCGGIENTTTYNANVDMNNLDPKYPNFHLFDMQGASTKDSLVEGKDGVVATFKKAGEVMMLCSECNFGKWHNEFNKRYATEDEKLLALYSYYNLITPFDQEDGVMIAGGGLSYSLNPFYHGMHSRYREVNNKHLHTELLAPLTYGKSNTDKGIDPYNMTQADIEMLKLQSGAESNLDYTTKFLYSVFIINKNNYTKWDEDLEYLLDSGKVVDFIEFMNKHHKDGFANDSIIAMMRQVQKDDVDMTLESYNFMHDMMNAKGRYNPPKKHWKLTQDPVDRLNKINLAEAKRKRKQELRDANRSKRDEKNGES